MCSPSIEQYKQTYPALRNRIPPSSSKPNKNPNKQVVPNKATIIAKPNFQGAAHNIVKKEGRSVKDTLVRAKL